MKEPRAGMMPERGFFVFADAEQAASQFEFAHIV